MKTLVPASEAMKNTFPALELMDSYEVPSLLCAPGAHTLPFLLAMPSQSHTFAALTGF